MARSVIAATCIEEGFAMLDGEAYKAHFPDDPAYNVAGRDGAHRMPNSAVLMAAFAALEHEFRTILSKSAPSTD